MQCSDSFIFILLTFSISFSLGKIDNEEYVNQSIKLTSDIAYNVTHALNDTASVEIVPEETKFPCTEEFVSSGGHTLYYSMNNDNLNHAMLRRNSSGHRSYFELNFAVQTDGYLIIYLSEKEGYSGARCHIYVGVGSNRYTSLNCNGESFNNVYTPDIQLSATEFKGFYIKTDNGHLQFGKEGDRNPLIYYSKAGVGLFNYYSIYSWSGAKIRYCAVEDYKEESLSRYESTPDYSMNDNTLNHVKVKRNYVSSRLFELHFAVLSDGRVDVNMWRKRNYTGMRFELRIGESSNQYTELYHNGTQVQYIHTPDILSSTQFREFYLKIDDDNKLQFGKEGDSSPLLSYSNADLGLLNYYGIFAWRGAEIRYSSAPVAELPCTVERMSFNPIQYSMDDVALNHYGRVKRNSTGHLTYFEVHVALKTDVPVAIQLSNGGSSGGECLFWVGIDGNDHTSLTCNGKPVEKFDTPDIIPYGRGTLSIYIKIVDGKLLFGKERYSYPQITYYDAALGLLNYYSVFIAATWAKVHYCPAPVHKEFK